MTFSKVTNEIWSPKNVYVDRVVILKRELDEESRMLQH